MPKQFGKPYADRFGDPSHDPARRKWTWRLAFPDLVELLEGSVVGYWPLTELPDGETQPPLALDLSGNDYHGTGHNIVAGSPSLSGMGKSYYFDGLGSYVGDFPSAFLSRTDWRDAGTAIMWVDPTISQSQHTLVYFTTASGTPNSFSIHIRLLNSPNRIQFSRSGFDDQTKSITYNLPDLLLENPFAIGMTWSVDESFIKSYIQGIPVGTPITTGIVAAATRDFHNDQTCIGLQVASSNISPYTGFIQHVLLTNSALSDDNMRAMVQRVPFPDPF